MMKLEGMKPYSRSGGLVSVLVDETIDQFNIDPNTLQRDSGQKVIVKCDECNEEFVREFRLTHLRHLCIHNVNRFNDFGGPVGLLDTCPVRLECKILIPGAKPPIRSRITDAGLDVYSISNYTIAPKSALKIETGIALSAPPGYYYSIDGRSSLWSQGIIPFRGIVDATYIGPISVVLMNTNEEPYTVAKDDRVAQLILHRIYHHDIAIVEEFSPLYNQRGANGFGSTGR